MTAWSAKVLTNCDLHSRERLDPQSALDPITPIGAPSRSSGTPSIECDLPGSSVLLRFVQRVGQRIRHLDVGASLLRGASDQRLLAGPGAMRTLR